MNLFKSKIICTACGKKYKHKLERKRSTYICSGYANYGKDFCTRRKIDEDRLVFLIKPKLNVGEITREIIEENIDKILIDKEGNIEIHYFNHEKSYLTYNQLIR